MNYKKVIYITIPLLFVALSVFATQEIAEESHQETAVRRDRALTKEEFFAKHHITGDTLIPDDFDLDALYEYYKTDMSEVSAKERIAKIKEDMRVPDIFEGFYYPVPIEVTAYYYPFRPEKYKVIDLTTSDAYDLGVVGTLEEYSRMLGKELGLIYDSGSWVDADEKRLVGRIGDDIYLVISYMDCGSAGCDARIVKRGNDGQWIYSNAYLTNGWCYTPDEDNSVYSCYITPKDHYWTDDIVSYEPLQQLYDRLTTVFIDYVNEYINHCPAKVY